MVVRDTDFRDGFEPLTAALARLASSGETAFTFVDYSEDRDGAAESISWSELDRRARALAARLAEVTNPGERVAILCPQNLDYVVSFYGSLYAGVISVPLFAPEVASHGERLVGALADSDPEVWLTSSSAMGAIRELRDKHPVPRPKQLLAVDTVDSSLADGFEPVPPAADQPAYLQYTSGSTRRPAGAVITHDAVAVNVHQVITGFGVDESFTCAGWLPFFHDMGLISLVCLPVAAGCPGVFTTPFAFTRRPARWLRIIGSHPNVITAAPNFAFEYAAVKLSDQDKQTLDLSGVRVAINGSEPVRAGTIDFFQEVAGPLGFAPAAHRPSYGLAEATVFVSTTPPGAPLVVTVDREKLGAGEAVDVPADDDKALDLVSAGHVVGQQVKIVADGAVRPDSHVGEIWINGRNVADGYWRQPERSAETFDGRLTDGTEPAGGWLRTGDLGVVHHGELFITGRLKDLIIIDGKNHYPQDIEATVQEAHPAIRRDRLAVFPIERDGKEGPVVVADHDRGLDLTDEDRAEIGRQVRAAVARHHDLRLLDFVLVPPGTVLRTSSGKIARAATRKLYLDHTTGTTKEGSAQ
ncbi:fatty acyl-AMP ligase [Kibdelosporangium phytohabitans]|uniref:Acyl-CoA synthetase n=1 Tax=Kibdelosporangium phytohabitans TaxID=860235 RepID=A0A0N9HTX4_9PSEU|nr:fatty acyl-AMP ligase [Kibdelosporangium phytohabitans]ALG10691.1 acyl-CoA synthetase [Kibdelosporangium phytohabitans]MBE1461821.1 fatty acid CoA ligase FadD32 [Kibdelosporangium phytohabitans]